MKGDEIEKPWCPCQQERYPNLDPDGDLQYARDLDNLKEVKSSDYYIRQREKNSDPNSLSRSLTKPRTPHTRRGIKIIKENFPDADLVCPCCEKEYVEKITRTVKEA